MLVAVSRGGGTEAGGTETGGTDARGRAYSASDPDLLRWVHVAFTDAFLSAQQAVGRDLSARFGRRWPDAYVGAFLTLMDGVTYTGSQLNLDESMEETADDLIRMMVRGLAP